MRDEKTNSTINIEMKDYFANPDSLFKWYQAIIIGFLSGIIPPMFQFTSIKWFHIAIGLSILFFIYNIWSDNRKKKK